MIYQRFIKPILDITLEAFLSMVLSPLFLIIYLILISVNQGFSFFEQTLPGQRVKPCRIIKFKTLNDNRDNEGKLLPDSKRLTGIGYLLRKTSLDDIPQLINVLKGDLGMVGPRPLLMQYLPHYNKEQSLHHKVKPVITGWTQVNGRPSISFTQRFELVVWYIKNISLKLDIIILVKTFLNIFKPKGVAENEADLKSWVQCLIVM